MEPETTRPYRPKPQRSVSGKREVPYIHTKSCSAHTELLEVHNERHPDTYKTIGAGYEKADRRYLPFAAKIKQV